MGETGPGSESGGETRERLARGYHINICRALVEYLEAEHSVRVRGDREANKLVVTFVVDDADSFHEYLRRFNLAEDGDSFSDHD